MGIIKKNLANLFTLLNLTSGFLGIIAVTYSDVFVRGGILSSKVFFVRHGYDYLTYGSICILVAALFDFLDGFTARKLKIESALGKQLDSLADLTSFGILPALIAHNLLLESSKNWKYFLMDVPAISYLPVLLVLAGALRLARFNTDDSQAKVFKGLSIPANAILWASFPLMLSTDLFIFGKAQFYVSFILLKPQFIILTILILSGLMVSNFPLMALKFEDFGWKRNKIKYIFLLVSLVLIVVFQFFAIPLIIIFYILFSWLNRNKIQQV